MPDEVTLAIASALASRGAEALVAGGRDALAALFRLVGRRFASQPSGGDTDGSAALAAAVADPTDAGRQIELATFLDTLMVRDSDFDAAVRAHWQSVTGEISASHGAVVNHFSGTADKVVQARDVRGNISL